MEAKQTHGGAGRGQGRKPGPIKDLTKRRAVYLTDGQWADLTTRGRARGLTASAYLSWLADDDERRRAA